MNNARVLRKENKQIMDELNDYTNQPKTLLQNMIYKYILKNKKHLRFDMSTKEMSIEE